MGDHHQPPSMLERSAIVLLTIIFTAAICWALFESEAEASQPEWKLATATWYGPGLYGGVTACGQHYTTRTRGTAHMTLPCGTRLTVCNRSRCVRIKVIDRGAFHPDNLDLSARTAQDLCACVRPYTQKVRYRRGWTHR